ncbi:MAG: hypothetical protein IPP83_13980 [Flavobacteriales bacterium]|nr:hypothetical protein [Flavobacteriales bacterium]
MPMKRTAGFNSSNTRSTLMSLPSFFAVHIAQARAHEALLVAAQPRARIEHQLVAILRDAHVVRTGDAHEAAHVLRGSNGSLNCKVAYCSPSLKVVARISARSPIA